MTFLRSSSLKPALWLLFLALLAPALATKHLHSGGRGRSPSVLRGASIVTDVKTRTPQLVTFSARLAHDTVLWNDLLQDGVRITSCTRDARERTASVVLSGNALDASDYAPGTVFVIDVEDWEKKCQNVLPASGVDLADDALFYQIKSAVASRGRINLSLAIVSGRDSVPTVDIAVQEAPADMLDAPHRVVYEGDELYSQLTSSAAVVRAIEGDDLAVSACPKVAFTFNKDLRPFDGADLNVQTSVSANVGRFRVVRLFKTEVQWEQGLKASARVELTVSKTFEKSVSKDFSSGLSLTSASASGSRSSVA